MDNKRHGWQIAGVIILAISVIASIIMSSIALGQSGKANQIFETSNEIAEASKQIAQTANQIAEIANEIANRSLGLAEKSYDVAYRSRLPAIVVVKETGYDDTTGSRTDTVRIRNENWVAMDFEADVEEILILRTREPDTKTYIELGFYYRNESTNNVRGLLLTSSYEGNQSYLDAIEDSFEEAAEKDGFRASMSSRTMVSVSYSDYMGIDWDEYFEGVGGRLDKMEEDNAREILDAAYSNRSLARDEDLRMYVDELHGDDLWNWYRDHILIAN
ncbi:MAG: hypothetical protein MUO97_12245 [Dehalococcoidia bacterium]|nr:hypothetical protein [Dehalococcoidia bacterium]